jgi:hypothetical protein
MQSKIKSVRGGSEGMKRVRAAQQAVRDARAVAAAAKACGEIEMLEAPAVEVLRFMAEAGEQMKVYRRAGQRDSVEAETLLGCMEEMDAALDEACPSINAHRLALADVAIAEKALLAVVIEEMPKHSKNPEMGEILDAMRKVSTGVFPHLFDRMVNVCLDWSGR